MTRQPSQHFGMFMGGIIIGDDVDRPVGDDFPLESVEKADEFARRWRCMQRPERGKQDGGAVLLVVVRQGSRKVSL